LCYFTSYIYFFLIMLICLNMHTDDADQTDFHGSVGIRVIRMPSHDFSLPQRLAMISAPTVTIAGMNGAAFARVPAGEAVVSGVGAAPEYCSSRM
jgi:hypothetical protein